MATATGPGRYCGAHIRCLSAAIGNRWVKTITEINIVGGIEITLCITLYGCYNRARTIWLRIQSDSGIGIYTGSGIIINRACFQKATFTFPTALMAVHTVLSHIMAFMPVSFADIGRATASLLARINEQQGNR